MLAEVQEHLLVVSNSICKSVLSEAPPPPPPPRSGLRSSLRASSLRKLGRKLASGLKNALPAQKLIFFVFLSRVRVWSVVRDGLGESEEGIKDISPLNSTHPSN
jgi:hypothetical protein